MLDMVLPPVVLARGVYVFQRNTAQCRQKVVEVEEVQPVITVILQARILTPTLGLTQGERVEERVVFKAAQAGEERK